MTNDRDITRYEVNEYGELPLSYRRYCRWEDVEDLLREMQERVDELEEELDDAESPCCDYDAGHEEGKIEGIKEGYRHGLRRVIALVDLELSI